MRGHYSLVAQKESVKWQRRAYAELVLPSRDTVEVPKGLRQSPAKRYNQKYIVNWKSAILSLYINLL